MLAVLPPNDLLALATAASIGLGTVFGKLLAASGAAEVSAATVMKINATLYGSACCDNDLPCA